MGHTFKLLQYAPTGTASENADPYEVSRAECSRMLLLIQHNEDWYVNRMALDDTTALSYYRGVFWAGDASLIPGDLGNLRAFRAQRNEIFPIVEDVASALSGQVPQVSMRDDPARDFAVCAEVQNEFSILDDLDETIYQANIHQLLFRKGAWSKTVWSADKGRPTTKVLFPWEVFGDPNARRMEDVSWIFERFVLPWHVYEARRKAGVYSEPSYNLGPDTFPKSIEEDYQYDTDDLATLRENGVQEFVGLHEFWDFRSGWVYHLHAPSGSVLMKTPIAYGNPYRQLVINPALGRMEGLPLVLLAAPDQQDINQLVCARREVIGRVQGKDLLDKRMFQDEKSWEEFMAAGPGMPARVAPAGDRTIEQSVFQMQGAPLSYDFKDHLGADVEHIRYLAGQGAYRHGTVENIRTAQEAAMIQAAYEGRLKRLSARVGKFALSIFEVSLRAWQWALTNANDAAVGCNARGVYNLKPSGLDYWTWARRQLDCLPRFSILPFSPLMENAMMRRATMTELLGMASKVPEVGARVRWSDACDELQTAYEVRPSFFKSDSELEASTAVAPGGPPVDASALAGLAPGGPAPVDGSASGALPLPPSPVAA